MVFIAPQKYIVTQSHLEKFGQSTVHSDLLEFIQNLNDAIVGVKLTEPIPCSPAVEAALLILDQVESLARSTPPVDNKMSRFGNPAFRDFYDKIQQNSADLISTLPNVPSKAIPELAGYFNESWGNRTRVDYGSGMELNFVCWLLCLRKLNVFFVEDSRALVIRVFWRYTQTMRHLQKSYWLEPAGSHGVWGLDDYHFLPFLWGAGQLKAHKYLRPKSIHDPEILEQFSPDYMYLACIQFINSIKTATLRWHSPMLDDISAVKTWSKVNEGMIKMFTAEVLGRLPVMQHFLFGSLLPMPEGMDDVTEGDVVDHGDHKHVRTVGDIKAEGFGDCCGILVPSAFAAGMEERKNERLGSLAFVSDGKPRLLPVD
ncbi:Phosphotyrosyl phosphatase activator [Phaffia rhodozyma]|uniref:Serine/threonine-protein phosphatase 2A activator n=1 Tax=Phaffia rhodozyma TaxID=264483 RepID=A0A0F7SU60_PHARH|nr:Phosphotyrosyl phosphatase activator [Phaffia rhodozyma]